MESGYKFCLTKSSAATPLTRDELSRRLHALARRLKAVRRMKVNLINKTIFGPPELEKWEYLGSREAVLMGHIESDLELCDRFGLARPFASVKGMK